MNITINVDSIDELCEVVSFLRRARPPARNLVDLDLSLPVQKAVMAAGISTMGQLAAMTEHELGMIPGLSKFGIRQIRNSIANRGWE